MNHIEQIFERCNMETISEFLIHGGELLEKNDDGYYERTQKTDKKISEWLDKAFSDKDELDENVSILYSIVGEIQSVYMQLGIRAGIMLATEFYEKSRGRF